MTNTTQAQQPEELDDEIDLIDLAITLGEEKKVIAQIAGAFTAIGIVASLVMTPIYTAKTVIIPPQSQQVGGAAAALAGLGALAGLAGGAKTPDEMYLAYMQSESVQNSVIKSLGLQERYDKNTMVETREQLKNSVKLASDKKSGLITLEAEDKDPEFAAKLANQYVDEFRGVIDRIAVTDAQQRRLFFEQQIKKVQQALAAAEVAFREAREKSGMQVTAVLAETGVKASAEMRGQIAAKEVQLQAMSRFATPQNPDVQRTASELAALRAQLNKYERGSGHSDASPLQKEAVNAYRDVKVQEAVLEVLIKQYEMARVEEAKEGALVQQIDVATPPEKRSKPKRTLIVLLCALSGLFVGVFAAFVKGAMRRNADEPEKAQQLQKLKNVWAWRAQPK